jgi:hypothetical protein
MCFTLRLHMSAAPPRVGLTQALGGKKHSAVALSALQLVGFGQHCSSDCSWARCLFGEIAVRAHTSHALRWPASETTIVICGFAASDPPLRIRPAVGSRGALKRPGFGFRSSRPQPSVAGIRPA